MIKQIRIWMFCHHIGRQYAKYIKLTDSVDRMEFLMRAFGKRYVDVLDAIR